MTRHVLTEKDEATLETSSASTAATWQEQGEKTLPVRTRIRAGVCECATLTETPQPAVPAAPLCPV